MKFFGQCVEAKAQLTFFISTEIVAAVFSCERSTELLFGFKAAAIKKLMLLIFGFWQFFL